MCATFLGKCKVDQCLLETFFFFLWCKAALNIFLLVQEHASVSHLCKNISLLKVVLCAPYLLT